MVSLKNLTAISPLHKKLLRDLWRLRGQVFAIAMVIASGTATLVMSLATIYALEQTSTAYYQQYRFADVFADLTRAPNQIASRIRAIEGVQRVQTRISKYATVDIAGFAEPVIGQLVSIPPSDQPLLNQLVLRSGRWVEPRRNDEVIVSEPFAEAHRLHLGDKVQVIMQGIKRTFTIVGTALSPEFIYSLPPGSLLPDDKRFGVLWLARPVLEGAYDLEDAFNQVSLSLYRGSEPAKILHELDLILEAYGGISAITRKDQLSNWFVMNEIEQQRTMGRILPGIFIAVSMFLTHMVLSRLIATERSEIGLLKAFGYSSWKIGGHYVSMVCVIALLGIVLGWAMGMTFGRMNTEMYAEMFRFPLIVFGAEPKSLIISALVGITAAILGSLTGVLQAIRLPPAQAMIPPAPNTYQHQGVNQLLDALPIDQPTRIGLRQITRWPARSFFTSLGIGFAVALMVMNMQWTTSLSHLSQVYFHESQRQHLTASLTETKPINTLADFRHLPGVLTAEPMRMVSVEFHHNGKIHKGTLTAVIEDGTLNPPYDDKRRETLPVPINGLAIAEKLATKMGLQQGDKVWIKIQEGRKPSEWLTVERIFGSYVGVSAFIELNQLNRLLSEGPNMGYANLLVDSNQLPELFLALKQTPQISAITIKQTAIDAFNQTLIEHLMVFISMFVFLAAILAFGVAYNSTRVALSERGRELATLRVLGFTRGEISYVLLSEVLILVLLGLPLGCVLGVGLVLSMATAFDTELFRIPLIMEHATFGWAILVVLIAAVLSALLVRKRIDSLDLIRVLKTRE